MVVRRTSAWRLARPFGAYARLVALMAGVTLCPTLTVAQSPAAATPADPGLAAGAPSPAATMPVEGFRQARFVMSGPKVRQAIQRDFPTAAERISRTTHPLEKTTVLAVTAVELLPDTGSAQLSYILGYASKGSVANAATGCAE